MVMMKRRRISGHKNEKEKEICQEYKRSQQSKEIKW